MASENELSVMRALGELSEGIASIRRELDTASESRKGMYVRIEEQSHTIANLGFEIEKAVAISAQAREEVKALNHSIGPLAQLQADLPDVVKGWKDLKSTSKKLLWVVGISGTAIVAFLIWLGETIRQMVLIWLGLPPPG